MFTSKLQRTNKTFYACDSNEDFDEINDDFDSPMRYSKRDLFRQFQDLPLPKKCPIKL